MAPGRAGADDAHRQELVQRARSSALIIAVTALVAVPAWSVFDLVLEPSHARAFITLRFACDAPILAAIWVLLRRPLLARPQLLALGVLAVVQGEIAWMVSRASENRQFYLLGFTLALYASGLLLAGSVRGTLALVGATFGSFFGFQLATPTPIGNRDLVAALTYLTTSSVIALLSHAQRSRLTRREFEARAELELEQSHNRGLLQRLEQQSRQDPLTELANRRAWDERLQVECERARHEDSSVALVLLDVDRFKSINDRHGHAGGDDALRQVAAVLMQRAPHDGLVARLGGDEFALLLPGMTGRDAAALAERVRADAQQQPILGADHVGVSVSQGVAAARGQDATPSWLMTSADRELYRAKTTRNAVSAGGVAPLRRLVPPPRPAGAAGGVVA